MTVADLIELLRKCNPEAKVTNETLDELFLHPVAETHVVLSDYNPSDEE